MARRVSDGAVRRALAAVAEERACLVGDLAFWWYETRWEEDVSMEEWAWSIVQEMDKDPEWAAHVERSYAGV